MSNTKNIPPVSTCDLLDAGHKVFWFKAIKTISYPRELCEIRIEDQNKVIVTLGSKELVMYNHEVPRIQAILTQQTMIMAEFCPRSGYLHIFHEEASSWVFSLSQTPLGRCEIDEKILRF